MRDRPGSSGVRQVARAILLCVSLLALHWAAPCSISSQEKQQAAPGFELTDLQGTSHRLADYRGKVVLLNFWATWCPECIEEMPSLNALYRQYRDRGLVVLGISADRKREPVAQAVRKTGVTYTVMLDPAGSVFIKRYTVIAMPTTVIIDRDGSVAERVLGKTDFTSPSFIRKIDALLQQGGKK